MMLREQPQGSDHHSGGVWVNNMLKYIHTERSDRVDYYEDM